jgi:hypothetical protein
MTVRHDPAPRRPAAAVVVEPPTAFAPQPPFAPPPGLLPPPPVVRANGAPGSRPTPRPVPGAAGRARPPKPDPFPLRVAFAMGGFAAASALVATIATSSMPVAADNGATVQDPGATNVAGTTGTDTGSAATGQSGSSATATPKRAVATQLPAPTPRVHRIVVTKQSGTP